MSIKYNEIFNTYSVQCTLIGSINKLKLLTFSISIQLSFLRNSGIWVLEKVLRKKKIDI